MESEETTNILTQLSPLHIGVIALAVVFLVIGLRLMLRKPPSHLTAFSGEAGTVLVSRKALQALIKQACLLDDWVEAARPVVRVRGQKVSSRVEVRLSAPDNLKDVCERLQERVTALLQKSLSFDQIGDIQIIVKGFSSSEDAPRQEALLPGESRTTDRPRESSLSPRPAPQTRPTEPESSDSLSESSEQSDERHKEQN